MTHDDVDGLVTLLLPRVLADRELGDGRSFTPLHLRNLWALSCLQGGRCYDEQQIAESAERHLPAHVLRTREVAAG
jgi:hypothetical protein